MAEGEFYVNLINNFLTFYKNHCKESIGTFFSKINYNDPTSTNNIMELFYEQMCKFKENEKIDKEYNKIYDYHVGLIELCAKNEKLYGLLCESEIKYCSKSLIALLIEQTNLQLEIKKDLKIIIVV
jgi:hypothetical protein